MIFGVVPSIAPVAHAEEGDEIHQIHTEGKLVAAGLKTYKIHCNVQGVELSSPWDGVHIPRNTCIVGYIADDGAVTAYKVTGPSSLTEIRRKYKICVKEVRGDYITHSITVQREIGEGSEAHIGHAFCSFSSSD